MTQEEKSLLLKDLCARLPYGVKIEGYELPCIILNSDWLHFMYTHQEFALRRPYLRSMSSMTEEELKEYHKTFFYHERYDNEHKTGQNCSITFETYDYLNKHHFDYRGLIKKGLALEALEGMYKF